MSGDPAIDPTADRLKAGDVSQGTQECAKERREVEGVPDRLRSGPPLAARRQQPSLLQALLGRQVAEELAGLGTVQWRPPQPLLSCQAHGPGRGARSKGAVIVVE
jgi:hypothetical protein